MQSNIQTPGVRPKSQIIARAPVRISFGGGGTDLQAYYDRFGGFVVSTAITRYCYVAASEPADHCIRINSADYQIAEAFGAGEIPPVDGQLSLPKAAVERFAGRGLAERGVDLFLSAEVPPGTGLGSSSAMAVALVGALASYTGNQPGAARVAEAAASLEIERLGMPIGKQDQYASAFGGLNTIDFTAGGVTVKPLPVAPGIAEALCSRLLLFATGQSRDSASILRQQRADTGAKPVVVERLHRMKALAWEMCQALVDEDLDRFGRRLHEAWQEKRQLSGNVSSAAIDRWYAAALDVGALGGKITGAGGGGFLMLYCPLARQPAVRREMAALGLPELPFDFDVEGAQLLTPLDGERTSGPAEMSEGAGWTATVERGGHNQRRGA